MSRLSGPAESYSRGDLMASAIQLASSKARDRARPGDRTFPPEAAAWRWSLVVGGKVVVGRAVWCGEKERLVPQEEAIILVLLVVHSVFSKLENADPPRTLLSETSPEPEIVLRKNTNQLWTVVAQGGVQWTSASWIQAILLPQPPE
ncbi:uncharacterized protein LOC144340835 isoform X3 [Macaca mulatta]